MNTDKHDPLDVDVRAVDTQWSIYVTEKFLGLTESQMGSVIKSELEKLEATLTLAMDYDDYLMEKRHHEDFYENGILPALRYSHVVLLHILVETRLRAFCADIKKEKKLPEILPGDFRGGPIEQIQLYLKKLVGIAIQELPGWESVRDLQKVRDCIVHVFGEVNGSRDKDYLAALASKKTGIQIDEAGKLMIEEAFCANQMKQIGTFFEALFRKVGWVK